jgi:hypothetical protein
MRSQYSALAKEKLVGPGTRALELERLSDLLDQGEQVVTMAEALFRSRMTERRGLAVLTDRRLLCIENVARPAEQLDFALSAITSLESRVSGGMGDARRGGLSLVADGAACEVVRINPWERAPEMASYIRSDHAGI